MKFQHHEESDFISKENLHYRDEMWFMLSVGTPYFFFFYLTMRYEILDNFMSFVNGLHMLLFDSS